MIDTAKLRILVVEDDDMNYLYLKQIFKVLKVELVRVNNGRKAIEIFKNEKFDVIFMDIQLPDLNGYEVTRNIRSNNSTIPIVAQTASKSPEDHEKAILAGCNQVLIKPYKIDDIRNLLNSIIS
jgi:CheY-like chemotaxis protein